MCWDIGLLGASVISVVTVCYPDNIVYFRIDGECIRVFSFSHEHIKVTSAHRLQYHFISTGQLSYDLATVRHQEEIIRTFH